MKKLVTIALMALALNAFSQSPPPLKTRSNDQFTQVDGYLAAPRGFSFPAGATNTLTGVGNRANLFWNTAENKLYVHDGVMWKVAGGGGSNKLKSSNTKMLTLSLVGDTTVLNPVPGFATGNLVGRIGRNGIAFNVYGDFIFSDPTVYSGRNLSYDVGTSSFGHHLFYTNSAQLRLDIRPDGNLLVPNLSTLLTAPPTSGTKKMLVSDQDGLISFDNIPSGGSSLSGTGFVKVSGTTISYDNTSYLPLTGGTLSGAVTGTTFTASGGFFDTSDIRFKKLVGKKFNAEKIKAITYRFKDDPNRALHVGYSAQQVKQFMPYAVKKDQKGKLAVNYTEVLVQKIADLEARLKRMEARIR